MPKREIESGHAVVIRQQRPPTHPLTSHGRLSLKTIFAQNWFLTSKISFYLSEYMILPI